MTAAAPLTIPSELVQEVCAKLVNNARVRRKLPGWGRVHIDRQLPFLCVYRRPPARADAGTERLPLGEAAYILASGEAKVQAGLTDLISRIVDIQVASFGAALLVELWSGEDTQDNSSNALVQQAGVRILALRHHTPTLLLEQLESALLGIEVGGQSPRIKLEYVEQIGPPGMTPLLARNTAPESDVTLIGLELSPVYRDPVSGELFPFELRELHHGLTHALKKAFYAFAHACTRHRPAHYHALGRRAMTSAVWETDRELAEISSSFDMLLHVTPVNVAEAWAEFQHGRFEKTPEFNYRPRPVDPDLVKRRLYQIPIERIEDPTLASIFSAKRDELDRQIAMIADRNTRRFLYGSQQVYAPAEDWLLQLAQQLLEQIQPCDAIADTDGLLDAHSFAARARTELDQYRSLFPELSARVEVRDDITGIMVSGGDFLVGSDARVPAARVRATLAHEIGTHILTYYNGRSQPFHQLYAGMAGYEPLQEGLAVLSEYLVGQLNSHRLRLLAARVSAVHCLVQGATFCETFRDLTRNHGFEPGVAFGIAVRVYRGGGFTKDAVYLRGLSTLLSYLGNGGDFELLLMGKIALEHLPFIEELRWRKVLHPGPLRPFYLDDNGAGERLARVCDGLTLARLVEECEQ